MRMITIDIDCPFCGKRHFVDAPKAGFEKWINGALIQNVLPSLSATEREQLISHICPTCQEEVFG